MIRPDPAQMPCPPSRHDRLDALRGAAIVWMAIFHFRFDLAYFRLADWDFYRDPFWLHQRSAIVSLFLLCAGMGQALALAQGQPWTRFWRRWGQIMGCALLVSLGSWLMFPRSFISFGVLHGMAVMLLLLRCLGPRLSLPALAALALLCLLLPLGFAHPWFDGRWTHWLGLTTRKPITEDYVPLLPWLGLMLAGCALARWRPGLLEGPVPRLLAPLARLGRWSLSFYMLHQPVLIGALLGWQATIAR